MLVKMPRSLCYCYYSIGLSTGTLRQRSVTGMGSSQSADGGHSVAVCTVATASRETNSRVLGGHVALPVVESSFALGGCQGNYPFMS